jgi:hypothetical protein
MILRDTLEWCFWFGLLAVCFVLATGCGQISPLDGAGGQGGGTSRAAGGGTAGAELARVDAAADPPPDAAADAAPDAPACISDDAPGLALGPTCDGGPPSGSGCHAACVLGNAPFVGCVARPTEIVRCYPSCGACSSAGGL